MDEEGGFSVVKREGKMRKDGKILTAGDKCCDCAATSAVANYNPPNF